MHPICRKEQEERQNQERLLQSAGSEARALSEIAKSPGFSDLLKFSSFPSPESAQFITCIDSSYDHWSQFADEHHNIDIYLNLSSRAKWPATMILNISSEVARYDDFKNRVSEESK